MSPISPKKSAGSAGTEHFDNTIGRKKLQTLQVSANDGSVLVGGQRLGVNQIVNQKFSVFHDPEPDMKASQENNAPESKSTKTAAAKPRRSQRKRQVVLPTVSNENDEVPSPKQNDNPETKTIKKTRKNNKGSSSRASSKQSKDPRQRKIMFCCLSKQTPSSSGSDPESTVEPKQKSMLESMKVGNSSQKKAELPEIVLSHMPSSSTPSKSPSPISRKEPEISEDFRYLITDNEPPESYWKEIAEQRLAALEETLIENEKLHDEIEVLKVENAHLLSCAEAAREIALFAQQLVVDFEGPEN